MRFRKHIRSIFANRDSSASKKGRVSFSDRMSMTYSEFMTLKMMNEAKRIEETEPRRKSVGMSRKYERLLRKNEVSVKEAMREEKHDKPKKNWMYFKY